MSRAGVCPTSLSVKSDQHQRKESGLLVASALVEPSTNGLTQALITNCYSFTQKIDEGSEVGHAVPVDLVQPGHSELGQVGEGQPQINMVAGGERGTSNDEDHKELLFDQLQDELHDIPEDEREQMVALLGRYHNVFSLAEGERGETDVTMLHINTGDTVPKSNQ